MKVIELNRAIQVRDKLEVRPPKVHCMTLSVGELPIIIVGAFNSGEAYDSTVWK